MNRSLKILFGIFLLGFIWEFGLPTASGDNSSEAVLQKQKILQDTISQRSQELQNITNKIKENQKNLEETQGQKRTLQKEVKNLDVNINQVQLGIQASEVTIQQLGLEIDSLGYSIEDTEQKISGEQAAIAKIIQELQQKEGDTPLVIFLRNKSLADSVFETETLADLNKGLGAEIDKLKGIKTELADDLDQKTDKKKRVEQENFNLKNKKIILAETQQSKQELLRQTKNKEQVYQQSIADLQKRQGEIAAEIEKIDEQLRLQINPSLLPTKRAGVLALPVIGQITQSYGLTTFGRYGYRGKWHNGVDFGIPIGTPVFSAEAGTVVGFGNQDLYCYRGAYGKFIAIQHDNNLTTIYAHLSLQIVREGDTVQRGQLIGYSGRTGYATGPHLHFGVYASQTFRIGPSQMCGPQMPYGGDINPLDYLPSLSSGN